MEQVTSFRLRECIGVERHEEWLTRGIPVGEGKLNDPLAVALLDEAGERVPVATEALTHWPDGSVKWLKVVFPATVASLATSSYSLVSAEPQERPQCGEVEATHESFRITNGVITLETVIASDCILAELRRNDGSIQTLGLYAELMGDDGREYRSMVESIAAVETGTRTALLVEGSHATPAGTGLLSFKAWLFLYPGQDYVDVEYQFVHNEPASRPAALAREGTGGFESVTTPGDDPRILRIRSLHIVIEHGLQQPLQYGTGSFSSSAPEHNQYVHEVPFVSRLLEGPRTQYYDFWINSPLTDLTNEKLEGSCHGLVDVSNGDCGVAASIYKYGQNWPKGVQALPDRLVVDILPEFGPALPVFQGQAKTTRVRIWLHDGDMRQAGVYYKHLAHNWPLHIDSPETFLDSGALPRLMPFQPDKYPDLESRFFSELDQLCLLERVFGMMDYGDHLLRRDASWGREEWFANNEHDFGYSLFLQYARTGQRRFFEQALAAWQHWMDVDTIHHSDNAVEIGGWRIHGPNHVLYSPGSDCSVSTSHIWAEGPIYYYLLTCHPAAREAVRMLGDFLCRVCDPPEGADYAQGHSSGYRDRGWPLLALSALYEAFGEEKYLNAARRLAELYITGPDPISERGDVTVRYCTLVKPASRSFMAIIALGLGRYYRISGDERFRELFLRVCRFILTKEAGGAVWEAWGNEQAGMEQVMTPHWREPLGYAYELTGDASFIEKGMRALKQAMPSTRPLGHSSAAVVGPGNNVIVADADSVSLLWRDLLPFLPYADELGLLEDF